MSNANIFSTCIVAIGLGLAFALAQAADPPKEGNFGKGKSGGPLLTRAELRECMAQQPRVRAHGADTVKAQAELDQEKAELARLGAALKEQLAALDRTSAEAVAAHNEQALAIDKRVDEYAAAIPAFNAKVEALLKEREAFAKACENRRFDEKDEIAIKNGK